MPSPLPLSNAVIGPQDRVLLSYLPSSVSFFNSLTLTGIQRNFSSLAAGKHPIGKVIQYFRRSIVDVIKTLPCAASINIDEIKSYPVLYYTDEETISYTHKDRTIVSTVIQNGLTLGSIHWGDSKDIEGHLKFELCYKWRELEVALTPLSQSMKSVSPLAANVCKKRHAVSNSNNKRTGTAVAKCRPKEPFPMLNVSLCQEPPKMVDEEMSMPSWSRLGFDMDMNVSSLLPSVDSLPFPDSLQNQFSIPFPMTMGNASDYGSDPLDINRLNADGGGDVSLMASFACRIPMSHKLMPLASLHPSGQPDSKRIRLEDSSSKPVVNIPPSQTSNVVTPRKRRVMEPKSGHSPSPVNLLQRESPSRVLEFSQFPCSNNRSELGKDVPSGPPNDGSVAPAPFSAFRCFLDFPSAPFQPTVAPPISSLLAGEDEFNPIHCVDTRLEQSLICKDNSRVVSTPPPAPPLPPPRAGAVRRITPVLVSTGNNQSTGNVSGRSNVSLPENSNGHGSMSGNSERDDSHDGHRENAVVDSVNCDLLPCVELKRLNSKNIPLCDTVTSSSDVELNMPLSQCDVQETTPQLPLEVSNDASEVSRLLDNCYCSPVEGHLESSMPPPSPPPLTYRQGQLPSERSDGPLNQSVSSQSKSHSNLCLSPVSVSLDALLENEIRICGGEAFNKKTSALLPDAHKWFKFD